MKKWVIATFLKEKKTKKTGKTQKKKRKEKKRKGLGIVLRGE